MPWFLLALPDVCGPMSTDSETQSPGAKGKAALMSGASRWDYSDMNENAQRR